jgi:hypothetical protein
MPITADTMPTTRSTESGASMTWLMARLVTPGNAANKSPSMAKTKPSATRKSYIRTDHYRRGAGSAPLPTLYFGAAGAAGGVAPLPVGFWKYRKNSESGRSTIRVSLLRKPAS